MGHVTYMSCHIKYALIPSLFGFLVHIIFTLNLSVYVCVCVCVCVHAPSCPTFCDPWTVAHHIPNDYEVFQAKILEWVAMSFSRGIFLIQGLNPHPLHLLN